MVERRGAFSEVTSLQKEINKLFEHLAHFDASQTGIGLGEWFPRVDVFETEGHVVVKVEAPGFGKNDLSVVFRGSKMILSGEKREREANRAIRGYLCLERSFGKFNRALYVDQAVDLTQATARLEQGVLTVTIPKLKDRRGTEFRLEIEDKEPPKPVKPVKKGANPKKHSRES